MRGGFCTTRDTPALSRTGAAGGVPAIAVANACRFTENGARVGSTEGTGTMPGTISRHIRIDEELWKRLEAAAGEEDVTANRLLAELAERWLETREWPQSEVQVRVRALRCSPHTGHCS